MAGSIKRASGVYRAIVFETPGANSGRAYAYTPGFCIKFAVVYGKSRFSRDFAKKLRLCTMMAFKCVKIHDFLPYNIPIITYICIIGRNNGVISSTNRAQVEIFCKNMQIYVWDCLIRIIAFLLLHRPNLAPPWRISWWHTALQNLAVASLRLRFCALYAANLSTNSAQYLVGGAISACLGGVYWSNGRKNREGARSMKYVGAMAAEHAGTMAIKWRK